MHGVVMNGWLVYDRKQYDKNKWFANELISQISEFCEMRLIIVEQLRFGVSDNSYVFIHNGEKLDVPDFVVCRTIFPLLSQALEMAGARVFNNSRVSAICNDKRLTYLTLMNSGVPILKTLFFDIRFSPSKETVYDQYPYILKSAEGHGGSEVFWINNEEDYYNSINKINSCSFLSQEVCATTGRDLRVYVLGGSIVSAVLRSSDGFKSNYSLGGRIELFPLNERQTQTVEKVLSALPFAPDFVGVDFLLNNGELIFNEIEDVVGTRMLYELSDINIANRFSKYIREQMT